MVFQVLLARTGAGKVVTFVRELLTPGGPSPMQMLGIPRVVLPLMWPMQGFTPVPFSSSCKGLYCQHGIDLDAMVVGV